MAWRININDLPVALVGPAEKQLTLLNGYAATDAKNAMLAGGVRSGFSLQGE